MNEYPGNPGPFDKDVLEEKKVLAEKDFIQDDLKKPPTGSFPIWIWLALLALVISLVWGSAGSFQKMLPKRIDSQPFLNVTNRQFSLFLWEFPVFMRAYAKNKTGYIPGFQYVEKQTLYLDKTDDIVAAPPEILFLYHTWNRLLSADYISRVITPTEFNEFLSQVEEWSPKYWKEAPEGYVKLIQSKSYTDTADLQNLPETTLPLVVKQAFVGWKNYFKEGTAINQMAPTFKQVVEFLKVHPHYARNYWRNIQEVMELEVSGKNYLTGLLAVDFNSDDLVPVDQLAPFLKVALYNAEQSEKEKQVTTAKK